MTAFTYGLAIILLAVIVLVGLFTIIYVLGEKD